MTEHAENFIPWEQIEPLLRSGMRARELATDILARVGLPVERYAVTTLPGLRGTPAEKLRAGVLILPRSDQAVSRMTKSGHEVIA